MTESAGADARTGADIRQGEKIMAIDGTRSMKKLLKFLFGLLINVCILFVLVKAFSYSYDFAYQVFATASADPADSRKVTVQIAQDETMLDVAGALKDAGVIDNKYAFILKVRICGAAGSINPGTYQIAPSDTNKYIMDLLTGVVGSSEDGEASGDSGKVAATGSEDHSDEMPDENTDSSQEDTDALGDISDNPDDEYFLDE